MAHNTTDALLSTVAFITGVAGLFICVTFAYQYGKVDGRLEAWAKITQEIRNNLDSIDNPK